jgi:hypothetical protein
MEQLVNFAASAAPAAMALPLLWAMRRFPSFLQKCDSEGQFAMGDLFYDVSDRSIVRSRIR